MARFSRSELVRPRWTSLAVTITALAACQFNPTSRLPADYSASITYTRYGVPHITARDWGSLGYGHGYAVAEDNLCVLADAFITFRGERSKFFGPKATQKYGGTLNYPLNIDSDFFFRDLAPDTLVARLRADQPAHLSQLAAGYAAGFSRYVREIRQGAHAGRHLECRTAPWLSEITDSDLYRRMYALSLTGGTLSFVTSIANARPGSNTMAWVGETPPVLPLGSNAIAFGSQATGTRHGLLFGNPHWAWNGADRFHQVHLTIPGELDVQGVAVLGVPLVMLGFNANVAWTHTVSTAKRFTPYRLNLVKGDPTSYVYDGRIRRMSANTLSVEVLRQDGKVSTVTRTLFRSHFGPLLDSGWTSEHATALRDVNAESFRAFSTWMELSQASSLNEFIEIQKRDVGLTFVNTVAVGRNDRRAWFADITTIPHVEDGMFERCNVGSRGLLDGARSECEWGSDPDSPQPGTFGVSKLPALVREDYVANMNDSAWLTNAHTPLTTRARIMGPTRYAQTLRTRMGHILAGDRLTNSDGYGVPVTSESVRRMVLNARALSAELFLDDVLKAFCGEPDTDLQDGCEALRHWDRRGDPQSIGAHVWRHFWEAAQQMRPNDLYRVPFDPEKPLDTPRELNIGHPKLAETFAASIRSLRSSPVALNAPLASYQYLEDANGERIPLSGGCGDAGYFTVVCTRIGKDGPVTEPHGNSYLQVVGFTDAGVEAYALLLPSQSSDPASPHYRDYTRAYSAKEWYHLPFTAAEVAAAQVSTVELKGPRSR